jgi:hypothetical protein
VLSLGRLSLGGMCGGRMGGMEGRLIDGLGEMGFGRRSGLERSAVRRG